MPQLEHIEAIEKRLWSATDTLRANSNYAGNEYFLPVMGLVFLRHAYSRFLAVKDAIEAGLPKRGGRTRPLTKEDFSQKSSIFLRPQAQFDTLVSLPDSADRARAIIDAMESIEADYESLRGILPKSEYQELDNAVLGQLLRTLNPEELRRVYGDVFGRIYEYFLTQFADQKAHDGGEFFTPVSLVSLIANVIEPDGGIVLDPACGSGGMFVQSARVVERRHENPTEKLTFFGLEKNATTIRMAKMNLAVHGLEGDIKKAITHYEDPHELFRKADFVMANPPFNVDEVDADKVKNDPRLPFGLPGVNRKGKVSNGNYVWISYFYSYLNERGRAGFVMSSQASCAGRDEAAVRRKLVETGDVDIMIAIRSNFFYTRTVPCGLWFLNRGKPEAHRDKVLMIDARNVYRKVTRKIYDFSPEQEQNLLAIVRLYRGETERYLDLVADYCRRILAEGAACFSAPAGNGEEVQPLPDFVASIEGLRSAAEPFLKTLPDDAPHGEALRELDAALLTFTGDAEAFRKTIAEEQAAWKNQKTGNGELKKAVDRLASMAGTSRDLVKQTDLLYKLACRLVETCENECGARESGARAARAVARARRDADEVRSLAVEQLKQVRYFWKQARWLTERFPDAKLRDVEAFGQTGGPGRNRSQRLEPHPRPLRRRGSRGRGRELRLRGGPQGDPCRTGRPERRGRETGRRDNEELRGAGNMTDAGLLAAPEGKTLEFKQDLSSPGNLLRTLAAFANTAGGRVIIGVKDKTREVLGIDQPLDEEERLCSLIADSISPRLVPSVEMVTVDGKTLLVIEVFLSNSRPHYLRSEGPENGVYVRPGSTNRKADRELVAELRRSAEGVSFDETPLPGLTLEDLDTETIKKAFEGIRPIDEQNLLTLRLAVREQGRIVPTMGGMLLFGRNRTEHFPDCWAQCGRFLGLDKARIFDHIELEEPLPILVDSILLFLKKHAMLGADFSDIRRRDVWSIPLEPLQEAVINSLVHADWSQRGGPVRVAFFDDRIEIENPGILPPGMTVEDMRRGVSKIRNPVIARANRVNEGKNNGMIVDYCGILKNLRTALATFAGTADGGRAGNGKENEPARPKEELLAELAEAVGFVRSFLEEKGASLDGIIRQRGFERNAAIRAAKEAANENDETRKRFEIMCRAVFTKFKACFSVEGINAFREDRDGINIVYTSLQQDREQADITAIIRQLHEVVDEAIETKAPSRVGEGVGPYDISAIDFDRLRKEFERSPAKRTTVQNLKAAIEQRLDRMLRHNPLRTDFQKHYEEIVEEYNREKDRVTIERTFEVLIKFIGEMNEDECRAVREGLDEESLAVFDLLKKPDLNTEEIRRIKAVAVSLLEILKFEKLRIDHWREKEATRDAVRLMIRDFLWSEATGLPAAYSDRDIQNRTEAVFGHVFRAYPTVPSPYYADAAS